MRILIIFALLFPMLAKADETSSYKFFSKSFRCPEDLGDDQEREKDIQQFVNWANEQYSDLTVSKLTELRLKLLKEHRCEATLKNIHQNSALTESAFETRSICKEDNGEKFFSLKLTKNCTPIPLESGWSNFHSGQKVLVDIMPKKIVKERDGIKIWTHVFTTDPIQLTSSKLRYDSAKGITKFYCKTRQQSLIQATYYINKKFVHNRTSSEAFIEEIEPGTIADNLYEYVCRN